MSKAKLFTKQEGVTREELETLMRVLGVDHVQFGALCGVATNSVNWWLREEKIPQFRLRDLADRVDAALRTRAQPTIEDGQVRALYQKLFGIPLEVMAATGSAVPGRIEALVGRDAGVPLVEDQISTKTKPFVDLSQVDTRELMAEIERRGFSVTLSLLKNHGGV